ncbi:uncharacterized protein Listericin [Drosophila tropicalis]|uniref:uncharacterized protein Listericin n=1 Tax=Drosophila tropicalis TaxID=46794 RepID=UPI0035ABD8B2
MKPYLMLVAFMLILASTLISSQPVENQQLTLEDVDGQQRNDVDGSGIRQVRHFFGGGRRGYFGGGGGGYPNPYFGGGGGYPYGGGGGYPYGGGNSFAQASATAQSSFYGR